MWFGPNQGISRCPAGGNHAHGDDAGNYSLVHDATPVPANHQAELRWCRECQGLWSGSDAGPSMCPEGGHHRSGGSGNYALALAPALAAAAGVGTDTWLLCGRCQGLCFGPTLAESACPAGGPHSPAGVGGFVVPRMSKRIRIHAKVVTPPTVPLPTMFHRMREVYASCAVDVEWASEEILDLPELTVVEAGTCQATDITAEQVEAFGHRNFVDEGDVVVYFVQSTDPPYNGCAAHPEGRPGAIVTAIASEWTLGHEIGHLLGLRHVPNRRNRLMTTGGTHNVTDPPPDLDDSERATLIASALLADL